MKHTEETARNALIDIANSDLDWLLAYAKKNWPLGAWGDHEATPEFWAEMIASQLYDPSRYEHAVEAPGVTFRRLRAAYRKRVSRKPPAEGETPAAGALWLDAEKRFREACREHDLDPAKVLAWMPYQLNTDRAWRDFFKEKACRDK